MSCLPHGIARERESVRERDGVRERESEMVWIVHECERGRERARHGTRTEQMSVRERESEMVWIVHVWARFDK